jgi:hypothetical protein
MQLLSIPCIAPALQAVAAARGAPGRVGNAAVVTVLDLLSLCRMHFIVVPLGFYGCWCVASDTCPVLHCCLPRPLVSCQHLISGSAAKMRMTRWVVPAVCGRSDTPAAARHAEEWPKNAQNVQSHRLPSLLLCTGDNMQRDQQGMVGQCLMWFGCSAVLCCAGDCARARRSCDGLQLPPHHQLHGLPRWLQQQR